MSALRTAERVARGAARPLLSLLFPPACWAEDKPLEEMDAGLSAGVREKIAHGLLEPYCGRCGLTVSEHAARSPKSECPRCVNRRLGVAWMARVGLYEAPLAKLITTLKFSRRWEVAAVLAPFVFQAIEMRRAADAAVTVDALVPVPLHWRRGVARGFNQAEELARHLGRLGGWPVHNALRRTRPTHEQTHMQSALQRRENLRGAFAARRNRRLAGKHVWLIDDVCTTGATLQAAARALATMPRELRPATVNAAVVCVSDRMSIADFSE